MKTRKPEGLAQKFSVSMPAEVSAWLREEGAKAHGGVSEVVRLAIAERMSQEAGAERSHLAVVSSPRASYGTARADSPSARRRARRDGGLKEG